MYLKSYKHGLMYLWSKQISDILWKRSMCEQIKNDIYSRGVKIE